MKIVRKERILEYLDNLQRQLSDLEVMKVPGPIFFWIEEILRGQRP